MKHAIAATPAGEKLVSAQHGVVLEVDGDQRALHVLPQLWLDYPDRDGLENCSFLIRSAALGPTVQPAGGVRLSRPLPNNHYTVAGCEATRYGWWVPLPAVKPGELQVIDLEMVWRVRWDERRRMIIKHQLTLRLQPGRWRTYTMDVSCWPRAADKRPKGPRNLYAHKCGDGPSQPGRAFERVDRYVQGTLTERMTEVVDLPAVPRSHVLQVDAFQEQQLHEVRQVGEFATGNETHRANACVELPAKLLLDAVTAAREISFGRGSAYDLPRPVGQPGACEAHPAIRSLTAWWNANAPDVQTRCAGLFYVWVRAADDGVYRCAYHETPDIPLDQQGPHRACYGRVGDGVLLEFLRGKEHMKADGGLDMYLVDGTYYQGVSFSHDPADYDEAWYTLEGLRVFHERFPAAYAQLVRAAGGDL